MLTVKVKAAVVLRRHVKVEDVVRVATVHLARQQLPQRPPRKQPGVMFVAARAGLRMFRALVFGKQQVLPDLFLDFQLPQEWYRVVVVTRCKGLLNCVQRAFDCEVNTRQGRQALLTRVFAHSPSLGERQILNEPFPK
jgi:hypothetical protein